MCLPPNACNGASGVFYLEYQLTTKETASALGVDERTIRRHAKDLGLTENGLQTNLDEKAVTIIKKKIERSGRKDLDNVVQLPNVTTELEMMILDAKVSEWKTRRIEELQKQLQDARPKIAFFEAVTGSKDTIDIGEASKVLAFKDIGRNTLFDILRKKGILMSNNQPYQKFIDAGYFRTIESSYTTQDGTSHINIKTVVYQRGLDYIRKVLEDFTKAGAK